MYDRSMVEATPKGCFDVVRFFREDRKVDCEAQPP